MTIVLFGILLFAFSTLAQAQMPKQEVVMPSPKYEVRAVWLTTIGGIDWPHSYATANAVQSVNQQKKELTTILDQLKKLNINTIHIQARVRATTIFPSSIEPWDGCLSGKPGVSPGYDALQFCIDECHRRGMECHAWIVTIPVGKWNSYGCKKLRQRYPRLIKKIGDEGYMDPEQAETSNYLAHFCAEVTRRYDIDGIHLDYIRYPETWRLKVSRQTGRQNITNIVRKIHNTVKAIKPWVKLSCSPIGKHDDLARYRSNGWNAYTTVCQDAQGWLRDGLMDQLFPMMYFSGDNFFPFAVNWKEYAHERMVAPGLAVYMLHPRERNWPLEIITRELYVLRQQQLGHTFFRSKFLTDNTKGIYNFVKDFNFTPALIPPIHWRDTRAPLMNAPLRIKRGKDFDQLSWKAGKDQSNGDYLLYNVYASEVWPVDTSNPENLVATRLKTQHLDIPTHGQAYHYAVTATNRYGQESKAIHSENISFGSRRSLNIRQLILGKPAVKQKKRRK
ncbi:MAG: family 10 glycosylhydrolase [Prevotella sp.]|nr:family 10 glycosylhydrolase [Prevotella sp.]